MAMEQARCPVQFSVRALNRWLPLVKWLLAIPDFIVLAFLWIAGLVAAFVAWLVILSTGRYPRSLFDSSRA